MQLYLVLFTELCSTLIVPVIILIAPQQF